MGEVVEVNSIPLTSNVAPIMPPVSAPPYQLQSPSLTEAPLIESIPLSDNLTPSNLGSTPIRKMIEMTKLDPHDAWLPITESRNGNACYAAFHTLCSGIGIQALVLPVAFTMLGWTWGAICLTMAFIWQLYTLWVLIQLHESADGTRYSRYVQLFNATLGEKLGKFLASFPIMYLSGGTCVALIILGGSTVKLFFEILCGGGSCNRKPLTTVEWYLVFTCAAILLSQLPNLNSIAGLSLIGAITAVGYCTIMWLVSVTEGRIDGVSYDLVEAKSNIARVFGTLNALGIIAFAFRGHNLVLEIQATMPSREKRSSRVPMWRGVTFAYILIAACLFPLAIGGYWAYGHKIPENGGMLTAIYLFHGRDTSRFILGLLSVLVVINAVTSFQIYGMPIFDHMEHRYTSRFNKACPWWVRSASRFLFGFICFFFAVAIPFLGSLAGLIGGIALPITLAYPCFMWIAAKKPERYSVMWILNWVLGISGMVLSGLVIAAGVWSVVDVGIKVSFFKPQ